MVVVKAKRLVKWKVPPPNLWRVHWLLFTLIALAFWASILVLHPLKKIRDAPDAKNFLVDSIPNTTTENDELAEANSYVKSIRKIGRPLIFFHIPKTAGTAIEFAAGSKHLSWGSCLFSHRPKRGVCKYPEGSDWPRHVGYWHLPVHAFPLADADPYQNSELFGVVRHPYDRMVSEFYYICTLRVLAVRPNQCDRDRLFDKDYMNEWLRKKLSDRESDSALGYLMDNGHFTPQYDFIFAPFEVRMLDHVLQMDKGALTEEFHSLMDAYGHNRVRLKKINALSASTRGDSDTHLDVHHLNKTALACINSLYSNDFDLGAYEKRYA